MLTTVQLYAVRAAVTTTSRILDKPRLRNMLVFWNSLQRISRKLGKCKFNVGSRGSKQETLTFS